jgi:prevent-host-death family protein
VGGLPTIQVANVHEAKTHLSRLLQRVIDGKEIVIANAGKPVARRLPYTPAPARRTPGNDADKVIISPDFDDPLPAFEAI